MIDALLSYRAGIKEEALVSAVPPTKPRFARLKKILRKSFAEIFFALSPPPGSATKLI
jgi:hypothetical protein